MSSPFTDLEMPFLDEKHAAMRPVLIPAIVDDFQQVFGPPTSPKSFTINPERVFTTRRKHQSRWGEICTYFGRLGLASFWNSTSGVDQVDTILKNAIESIQLGLEDYHLSSKDPRRVLSAIRNVCAGTLLLFKHKLHELSPADSNDVLVKEDMAPVFENGQLTFKGTGKKSVTVNQIQERFASLGIRIEWQHVNTIQGIRNEIEHEKASKSPAVIQELLAKSFVVVRDFIETELKQEPSSLLGDATWQALLKVADVHLRERAACRAEMTKVDWNSAGSKLSGFLRCGSCESELLKPVDPTQDIVDLAFRCSSCNAESRFEDIMPDAMQICWWWDPRDGDEDPIGDCPECSNSTFVLEEGMCLICSAELDHTECAVCYTALGPEDQEFNGLCGYHYNQATSDD